MGSWKSGSSRIMPSLRIGWEGSPVFVNNKTGGALESVFVSSLSVACYWLRRISWSLRASLESKKYLTRFSSYCGICGWGNAGMTKSWSSSGSHTYWPPVLGASKLPYPSELCDVTRKSVLTLPRLAVRAEEVRTSRTCPEHDWIVCVQCQVSSSLV